MAEERVSVTLRARDLTKRALSGVRGRLQRLKKSVFSLRGAFVALGAAFAAGKIGQALIKIFVQQQDAVEGLASALRQTGKTGSDALEQLTEHASQLQRVTRQGDEAILAATESLTLLAPALNTAELESAQRAIIGLGEGLFKGDIQSAATMMGKAIGGTTNSLTRYGIQVDMAGSASERLNEILAQSARYFEVAKDKAKTVGGSLQQLSNAYGDLQEKLGEILAKGLKLSTGAGGLTNQIVAMTAAVEENQKKWESWVGVALWHLDFWGLYSLAIEGVTASVAAIEPFPEIVIQRYEDLEKKVEEARVAQVKADAALKSAKLGGVGPVLVEAQAEFIRLTKKVTELEEQLIAFAPAADRATAKLKEQAEAARAAARAARLEGISGLEPQVIDIERGATPELPPLEQIISGGVDMQMPTRAAAEQAEVMWKLAEATTGATDVLNEMDAGQRRYAQRVEALQTAHDAGRISAEQLAAGMEYLNETMGNVGGGVKYETDEMAFATINAFSQMAYAAQQGSRSMVGSLVGGVSGILAAVPGVGTLASAAILAGGSLVSSLAAGGRDPVSVRVDSYGSRAIDTMRDAEERVINLTTIIRSDGAEMWRVQQALLELTRQDGSVRIVPVGGSLG